MYKMSMSISRALILTDMRQLPSSVSSSVAMLHGFGLPDHHASIGTGAADRMPTTVAWPIALPRLGINGRQNRPPVEMII